MNNDEAREALGRFRNGYFAEMVTVLIGLAVETHAEEIKAALGKVFDLSGVETMLRQTVKDMNEARRLAEEVRALYLAIQEDLERIEKRQDGLCAALQQVAELTRRKEK